MTRDNIKNRKYTKEEKEKLISRMLPPESISPSKLSVETGISKSTLATWKTKVTVSQIKGTKTSNNSISSREKFLIVIETYTMSENDLGKYCRENGLYVEEVKQWRSSCIAANDGTKAINSTFYRILREENMQHHRMHTKRPKRAKLPTTFIADAPNQVWTWDITWLNTYTRGIYYKLYMVIDIYSRKIVASEVWNEENGELASELIERAILSEKVKIKNNQKPVVLHSDNGEPMKSYTLKAKLEVLGVISSYSRPRVSS